MKHFKEIALRINSRKRMAESWKDPGVNFNSIFFKEYQLPEVQGLLILKLINMKCFCPASVISIDISVWDSVRRVFFPNKWLILTKNE
jgi:hypothetical protein